eukprot:1121032-Pelagomonas_calceolata.AAC.1
MQRCMGVDHPRLSSSPTGRGHRSQVAPTTVWIFSPWLRPHPTWQIGSPSSSDLCTPCNITGPLKCIG